GQRSQARLTSRDSGASIAERFAAYLYLLHDLGPAHLAGFAARPLHLRGLRGMRRALHGVLHADASRIVRGADRIGAIRHPHRPVFAGTAVRLDWCAASDPAGSIAMSRYARLKSTVAVAAILAQLAAQTGPAAAFRTEQR